MPPVRRTGTVTNSRGDCSLDQDKGTAVRRCVVGMLTGDLKSSGLKKEDVDKLWTMYVKWPSVSTWRRPEVTTPRHPNTRALPGGGSRVRAKG